MALFIQFSEAKAKDFGVQGHVFEIVEENMLEHLKGKLENMKELGIIDAKNQEMKDTLIKYINRPTEVKEIVITKEPREYEYDPSYIVKRDIADQDGRVFIKAGKIVNPLEYMPLSYKLIFIDGDDEEQVKWAIAQSKKEKVKITLIRGSIIDLMKESKVRLYFDQKGNLTKKFGIKQVPAIVEQKDLKLKIREVKTEDL
ncbi:MAG: type-F conjugative transfer system protein TraW [Proteobacteria bacterium]|nr:type-F conjugative transfer system protein TraW [Pseudomonadota bacterium]